MPTTSSLDSQTPLAHDRWPVLAGSLLTLLLLGFTLLYWLGEVQEARNRRSQTFTATVDRIAYSLRERMGAYEIVLRG